MAEIKVKGLRSCQIWQSLKKDLNAHGFLIIIHRKLIFGRMTEVHEGITILYVGNDLGQGQGQGHNIRSQRSNFGPKFRLELLSTHCILGNYGH